MNKDHLTIICDVDDTVCPSTKIIDKKIAKEINRLLSKKNNFVFISGSTVKQIYGQISNSLFYEHHLMGTTGTEYVIVNHGIETIWKKELKESEIKEILTAFKLIMNKFNIESLDLGAEQLQDRGSQVTLSVLGRNAPSNLKKSYDPDGSKRESMVLELKKILGDRFSINIGGSTSVDITLKGMDKGSGIKEFLDYHKLDPDNCMFYGDKLYPGGNDYPVVGVVPTTPVESWEETLELFCRI